MEEAASTTPREHPGPAVVVLEAKKAIEDGNWSTDPIYGSPNEKIFPISWSIYAAKRWHINTTIARRLMKIHANITSDVLEKIADTRFDTFRDILKLSTLSPDDQVIALGLAMATETAKLRRPRRLKRVGVIRALARLAGRLKAKYTHDQLVALAEMLLPAQLAAPAGTDPLAVTFPASATEESARYNPYAQSDGQTTTLGK